MGFSSISNIILKKKKSGIEDSDEISLSSIADYIYEKIIEKIIEFSNSIRNISDKTDLLKENIQSGFENTNNEIKRIDNYILIELKK